MGAGQGRDHPRVRGEEASKNDPLVVVGDHPRVRGEEKLSTLLSHSMPGSPPRARGRGVSLAQKGCGVGITPACAGKS